MTTVKVNVKFGQQSQNTSLVSFEAQLAKPEIQKHLKDMSKKVRKYNVPFAVIEVPLQAKNCVLPKLIHSVFKQKHFETEGLQGNGVFYHLYSLKSPLTVGVISKVQKLFKEITHLQNKLYLNLHLNNVDDWQNKIKQNEYDIFTIIFDKASIEGEVDLDGKFFQTIGLIGNRLSPQFSQSPLIAGFKLFGGLQVDLQLYSPMDIHKKSRVSYTKDILKIQQPEEDEGKQTINDLISIKEPTTIYVHFKNLGYLKIQLQTRILGYLHYFVEKPHLL